MHQANIVATIVYRLFPNWLNYFFMHLFLRAKYDVKIGCGAHVRLDNKFEGHNSVYAGTDVTNSEFGRYTYIANNSQIHSVKVGRFTAISDGVRTFVGRHPTNTFVSIHGAFYSKTPVVDETFVTEQKYEDHLFVDKDNKYVVLIGNDVLIGSGVLIMDGVSIGDGAVVAARSVVTKNVEPYSVVAGVPARKIKSRYSQEKIDFLMQFKWWEKDIDWIRSHASLFSDIDEFHAAFLKGRL